MTGGGAPANRTLWHGDNLEAMRAFDSGTVDLIYADPPFNSGIRRKSSGSAGYDDRWTDAQPPAPHDCRLSGLQSVLETAKVCTDPSMAAYLGFMAPRLAESQRVLRPGGVLCLHCDHHASHWLRVILDLVFGSDAFCNEIIWCYSSGGVSTARFAQKHDTIFVYATQGPMTFNTPRVPYWSKVGSNLRDRSRFHADGKVMLDWWSDIPILTQTEGERTGWPTQKPAKLLSRIIEAYTDAGDMVLDPFVGSGTTCVAAEVLDRRWCGIDISSEAVDVSMKRMNALMDGNMFAGSAQATVLTVG